MELRLSSSLAMLDPTNPAFWLAVLQIIMIDILLGGDNAVVIALACRKLPEAQRKQGIFWGVAGAIVLRVIMIFFALQLLAVPWLKTVGAALLFWIGIKLMQPEDEDGHGEISGASTLLGAIKTVIVADAVMSLDNVIAVAAAAHRMDRYPVVITFGAALLGWIGGGMIPSDPGIPAEFFAAIPHAKIVLGIAGALLVVMAGKLLAARATKTPTADIPELRP